MLKLLIIMTRDISIGTLEVTRHALETDYN